VKRQKDSKQVYLWKSPKEELSFDSLRLLQTWLDNHYQ
jgi:hypothetical protein